MAKRRADTDLNHDNWDRDDDHSGEEAATSSLFKRASDEELARRKIKVARRRSDVTTGGNEGPSVFKNFSAFGNMGSAGSKVPMFEFGAKKTDTSGSGESKMASFGFGKLSDSSEKKMFEASSFKIPSFTATPAASVGSTFSFSSTTCNKENSEPTEATKPSNSLGESGAVKSSSEAINEGNNTAYLASLKALNEGVLKWIQKHLDDNININLNPVFDDYRKHFDELQKRYKPKFSKNKKETEGSSSSKNVETLPESQTKFISSSNTLSSTMTSNKSETQSIQSPKISDTSKTPSFSCFTSTDAKSKESAKFSFGSSDLKPQESSTKLPFLSSEPVSFCFASSDTKNNDSTSASFFKLSDSKSKKSDGISFGGPTGGLTFDAKDSSKPASGGFSFGSGTSLFSFGAKSTLPTAAAAPAATEEADDDSPPKPEVIEVKEEGAVYEKKCKLFYKKDGVFTDKGVGTFYLKPVPDTKKTQLLIRASTNLGNVLLNILLNPKLPTQRMGKNNVLIVCVPNPPVETSGEVNNPVSMLIRVKTSDDADELLEKIVEHKGKDEEK